MKIVRGRVVEMGTTHEEMEPDDGCCFILVEVDLSAVHTGAVPLFGVLAMSAIENDAPPPRWPILHQWDQVDTIRDDTDEEERRHQVDAMHLAKYTCERHGWATSALFVRGDWYVIYMTRPLEGATHA